MGYVEYGKTPAYGATTAASEEPDFAQLHHLGGLETDITYHYRRISVGVNGERVASGDTTFSDSNGDLQHRMPFTLDIDWGEVITSLKHVGYHGLLTLDCGGGEDASLEGNLEMLDAQLVAVAERFARLLDYRET